MDEIFSPEELQAVYRAILTRRDVRAEFTSEPIPPEVLARLLIAAHHAPSVGFMQPWDFIVITDPSVRNAIKSTFVEANQEAAALFQGKHGELYPRLKLEGIMEAPINLCITCTRTRTGKPVLGRTHMPEMDLYSTVCAVQNLWLAARGEGIGVGWVSIFAPERIKEILRIPDDTVLVAYLCMGYVSRWHNRPDLERVGWAPRLPLEQLIHMDGWGQQDAVSPLCEQAQIQQKSVNDQHFLDELISPATVKRVDTA